jgi:hypothetical protein
MVDPRVIKHPLEGCVTFGSIGDLDPQGRDSLDSIMTMIGDMRFRKDTIEGVCARYFLLVDLSVLQNLCAAAHLNFDKLQDYIRRCDCEGVDESTVASRVPQAVFPFAREEGAPTFAQDPFLKSQFPSESDMEQAGLPANGNGSMGEPPRTPHEMQIGNPSHGPAGPETSAAQMMSDKRGKRPSPSQGKRA